MHGRLICSRMRMYVAASLISLNGCREHVLVLGVHPM